MNILFFGPNGSGKGTQGAIIKERLKIPHIETGAIFRENISKGTELGERPRPIQIEENWFLMISPSQWFLIGLERKTVQMAGSWTVFHET